MSKIRLLGVALASLGVMSVSRAVTVVEDFSTDPHLKGWQVFGETNLFGWNSTNGNLEVTWDSSRSNSYFYYPLGAQFTRADDFSVEFDLFLSDIGSGNETGKAGPLQIGFGFLNFAGATSTNFMRGAYGGAPNVAEFDYYPSGYYDLGGYILDVVPTTTPSFISGVNSRHYAPVAFDAYEYELPTNQPVHVRLAYTGSDQTAALSVTVNGVPFGPLPGLVLDSTASSQFTLEDDVRIDMFSISSYSSAGDDYDSVLAHGRVDNLLVSATVRPIGGLTGGLTTNGVWQARFFSHSNWLYTLERTTDFQSWAPASAPTTGQEGQMALQDTNAPSSQAFYRVRAQ